jgi:CBS domain-containing protein
MGAVSNLLDSKGHDVLTVDPDSSIHEAIKKMAEISAGTALVMEGGNVIGILSERDVIRKILLQTKCMHSNTVRDIMTTQLTTITPDTSLEDCMKIITEKRIRHLPVLQNGRLSGIISIGDVVKYLLIEKDFKIKNLETYINGSQ